MSTQQAINIRTDDRAAAGPEAIGRLVESLRPLGLGSHDVDAPSDPKGEWFIDLSVGEFDTSVSYRPGVGFGVFTSEAVFGARPDEIYREPHQAAIRLRQLADQWTADATLQSPGLKDLRLIVDLKQAGVAEAMGGDQTAVSRLEKRSDHKLSTIFDYVEALGGRLELRVCFDSFETPIHVCRSDKTGRRAKGRAEHAS